MKSFEYKNGVYEPTCGVWISTFFEDVINDLRQRNCIGKIAKYNGVSINIYPDSNLSDICDKYDYKRAYLQLKAKYEE